MSRCLVTGAAGFVGSHLCERLLNEGHEVIGLDAFIDYYPRPVKEKNLAAARQNQHFYFYEADLRQANLHQFVQDCDVVFHEAAMAGLMRSWRDFDLYASCNELGTLRLLEAVRDVNVPHLICISTSSVYGREATGDENSPLRPFSPYGITKLAAENLARAFTANFDVPVTILRYFSVYGPRQRPDMAYNILVRCLLDNQPFTVYGDGEQSRSNTFVHDCVNATVQAFEQPQAAIGETFNIGGGECVSLNRVIGILENLTGQTLQRFEKPPRPGDQQRTSANIEKARRTLGYEPATPIEEGLRAQVEWQKKDMLQP